MILSKIVLLYIVMLYVLGRKIIIIIFKPTSKKKLANVKTKQGVYNDNHRCSFRWQCVAEGNRIPLLNGNGQALDEVLLLCLWLCLL